MAAGVTTAMERLQTFSDTTARARAWFGSRMLVGVDKEHGELIWWIVIMTPIPAQARYPLVLLV